MPDEEKKEPDFEIIDKRKITPENLDEMIAEHEAREETRKEEPISHRTSTSEAQDAQERASGATGEQAAIDVYSLLQWMIGLLHQHAWQSMGLVPNPATGKIERDLSQAKVAIDCVAFMVNQVLPHVPSQVQRELRATLSDLQLNFVTQSQRG